MVGKPDDGCRPRATLAATAKPLPTHDKLLVLAEWLEVRPQQSATLATRFSACVEQRTQALGRTASATRSAKPSTPSCKLPAPQRKLIREVILTFAKVHAAPVVPPADPAD
ncbi:MAG: hypothetical protein V9G10_07590 [Candidatus Nanopelagicales bacterium]